MMWKAIVAAVAIGAALVFILKPSGFDERDVEEMKKAIRAEYLKRESTTVEEVELLRKSDTEITGFVKFKVGELPVATHACSATLEKSSGKYLWRCSP